jgi:hypothetical protein
LPGARSTPVDARSSTATADVSATLAPPPKENPGLKKVLVRLVMVVVPGETPGR